jgi:predicted nucleotidyltransferase
MTGGKDPTERGGERGCRGLRTVVAVTRDEIVEALVRLGVPIALLVNLPSLPEGTRGLLMYGSQARGDAVAGSDVDLLALAETQKPSINAGAVNISFYTRDQLSTGVGTLFGAHLHRDAKIVWDDGGLTEAVRAMGEVDTGRLLQRVRRMSELFTSLQRDLPKYLPGLLREARYLLRSCLYAEAIEVGNPCFSVRELAARHRDPNLSSLLASRPLGEASTETLNECLVRLRRIIGEFPQSSHGSLEATVVNEWERPGDLLSMAFLALGITGQGSDYAEVEKILL